MIWGNLNSSRYVPEVLQPEVDPFFQGSPRANFQQNNKRPRVSKAVLYFCSAQQKQLLFWPACSPDLSPIEHVWDLVVLHLPFDPCPRRRVQGIWNCPPQTDFQKLFDSMPRRVAALIAERGICTNN